MGYFDKAASQAVKSGGWKYEIELGAFWNQTFWNLSKRFLVACFGKRNGNVLVIS